MDILCAVSGHVMYWLFNMEKPQGHIRNSISKRGRAYLASLFISYIEIPGGEYDLALTWGLIMRLLSLLFYERLHWQDIGMMSDSVLRTKISVDSIIRKSENHAP